jgi:hypothetical protein
MLSGGFVASGPRVTVRSPGDLELGADGVRIVVDVSVRPPATGAETLVGPHRLMSGACPTVGISADFRTAGSGQGVLGKFVAEGAVSPPGHDGVGEVGLAEYG